MNFYKSIFFLSLFLWILGPSISRGAERGNEQSPYSAENDRTLRLREFVVMGYEGISMGLRSGQGPYIQTLLDLLAIKNDSPKTLARIQTLLGQYPNIMDFADQIILIFKEGNTAAYDGVTNRLLIPEGPTVHSGEKLENALSHLTKGMKIKIFLKGGAQENGFFEDIGSRKLWIRGASRKYFYIDEIIAVDAPQL